MKIVRLLCMGIIGFALIMHVLASLNAWGGVFDDVWGIRGIPYHVQDHGLLNRLLLEWSQPTYDVASGGKSINHAPWGPLTATLWDVLAAIVGRDDIVPFRLLNVVVFALLLLGIYRTVSRVSGGELAGWVAATAVAVHPLTVETVAWSSDLFDLLGATIIVWGFYALSFCRTTWQMVLTTIVFTLLAGFAKPTAALNSIYFPLILLFQGRERRQMMLVGLTAVATTIVHQELYGMITDGANTVLGEAIALTLANPEHVGIFLNQLGVQTLQILSGIGPRVSRMVYATDSWAHRMALAGYGSILAVCLFSMVCTVKNVWSKRLGMILIIIAVLWVLGNVPGTLYGMRQKGIGVRYCFMPAVCTIVCLTIWAMELRKWFVTINLRPVYAFVTIAVMILGFLSWGNTSLNRLPVWQTEGIYLEEELRLSAEWQQSGKAHPEAVAFYHFSRLRAVTEGREAPSDAMCGHLADWESATTKIEEQPRLYYIDNLMERPRQIVWEYAFSQGRCTRLDHRMRDKLVSRGVATP